MVSHSIFVVHVPVVSVFVPPGPDNDVFRAPAFEKNREKGNLIEMAEGATTLKGLRAQIGKKTVDSHVSILIELFRVMQ